MKLTLVVNTINVITPDDTKHTGEQLKQLSEDVQDIIDEQLAELRAKINALGLIMEVDK